jgi:hypothetical protein
LLCLAQPGPASLAASQVRGQIVAAGGAVELVLGGVDAAGLFEDLRRDLLVAADRVVGGGRVSEELCVGPGRLGSCVSRGFGLRSGS